MGSRFVANRPLRLLRDLALAALVGLFATLGASLFASDAEGKARAAATGQAMPSAAAGVAVLEECVSTGSQAERAATFAGEMSALPGTVRMAIRIDVEERGAGEAEFHTVVAPGLGVWRPSDARVKVYKYLKQVTNLSMPASYRGLVRFRWIGPKGRVIKRAERLTATCAQPATGAEPVEPAPSSSTGASSAGVKPTA